MTVASCFFFVSLCIIIYTYIGYPVLLWMIAAFLPKRKTLAGPMPAVTIIIPAYNELGILAEKIANTMNACSSLEDFYIIVITDGSDDGSVSLTFNDARILHLHEAARKGKSAAINRAMLQVKTPFAIITDANAMVNAAAFEKMLGHFADPLTAGVSGEKRVAVSGSQSSAGSEGIYWKYESFLKKKGAEVHTVSGAAGELFGFRSELFEPIPTDAILDDFMLSMRMVQRGYRIGYEPGAFAIEPPSRSIGEEFSRKVRISSGVWQSLPRLSFLFNPFADFRVFFLFISHRFLRWTLAPLSLPVLLISNAFLLENPAYRYFFIVQVSLYLLAAAGYFLRNTKLKSPVFFVPFYYLMMNVSVLAGYVRYRRNRHSVLWKKENR